MPTDTARRRAGRHATKHRRRFGMAAQRYHCTDDHMAGAAAQLAADIKLVEALKEQAANQDGDLYAIQPLMQVLAALRRLQDE